MSTMPPEHRADLDAVLTSITGSDDDRRQAIADRANVMGLRWEDVHLYLGEHGLLAPTPKALTELVELARAHGWYAGIERGIDTGGNPYLTVHLQRGTVQARDSEQYRVSWHTRDHGTFRLFSMLVRKLDGKGWVEPRSLRAIRADVARPVATS